MRPPHPPELRAEAVRLVRAGAAIAEVARDLGSSVESLRIWVKQADTDEGRRDGLTTEERDEMDRLRRPARVLETEREILARAAAIFAKETGRTP